MDIGNLDNVFKSDKSTSANKDNKTTGQALTGDAKKQQDGSLDDMMSQVGDYDSNGPNPTVKGNQDDDSDDDTNAKEEPEDLNKPDAKSALAAEAVATGAPSK